MKKTILLILLSFNSLLAQPNIEVYNCYGNSYELIVEGRVLTERSFKESKKKDSWLSNAWENLGHLINDETKNTPITLEIDKEQYHAKTDDEGYFEFDVTHSKKSFKNQEPLELFLNNESISILSLARILNDKPQVGIISDFDDTLIVSEVTNKFKLLDNLFFKNYKQREVVAGMAERFKTILSKHDSNESLPFFIITGSPKQLDHNIRDFLDYHHFPPYMLITKKIHGKNSDPLFNQVKYKQKKIEKLIALYPNVQWRCFGDSGEQDQKVYSLMAQKYPKHIQAIFIRNIESGKVELLYDNVNLR